jgi:site-specific recombinase XerD
MAQAGEADRPVRVAYRAYMVRRHYARTTIDGRMARARRWMRDEPGWRATDFRRVEEWVAELGVAPRSQRNALVALRAFYRWALREGLTDTDPTALVDGPRLPVPIPRPARDEHIAHVLAGAGAELAAIIGLMSCGGLRCGEVAGLRWGDVDLAEGSVHVTGKGSRERRVFLGAESVALLAALDGIDGPVFPGIDGGHRQPARVSQLVGRAFRAAGYRTTAHQLRHRAATTALTVPGVDLLAVRDMLGHASVATTQGYTAVVPGLAARASRGVKMPVSGTDSRAA